jgi:hypothetical protein
VPATPLLHRSATERDETVFASTSASWNRGERDRSCVETSRDVVKPLGSVRPSTPGASTIFDDGFAKKAGDFSDRIASSSRLRFPTSASRRSSQASTRLGSSIPLGPSSLLPSAARCSGNVESVQLAAPSPLVAVARRGIGSAGSSVCSATNGLSSPSLIPFGRNAVARAREGVIDQWVADRLPDPSLLELVDLRSLVVALCPVHRDLKPDRERRQAEDRFGVHAVARPVRSEIHQWIEIDGFRRPPSRRSGNAPSYPVAQ